MAANRICFMCGSRYEWCNTCHDYDPTEIWKHLYHDKNCLAISQIWYAYRGNEISKEEAKRQMDEYPENIAMILNYYSVPAQEIKEIYGKKEEYDEIDLVEEETQEAVEQETAKPVSKKRARSESNHSSSKNSK